MCIVSSLIRSLQLMCLFSIQMTSFPVSDVHLSGTHGMHEHASFPCLSTFILCLCISIMVSHDGYLSHVQCSNESFLPVFSTQLISGFCSLYEDVKQSRGVCRQMCSVIEGKTYAQFSG